MRVRGVLANGAPPDLSWIDETWCGDQPLMKNVWVVLCGVWAIGCGAASDGAATDGRYDDASPRALGVSTLTQLDVFNGLVEVELDLHAGAGSMR